MICCKEKQGPAFCYDKQSGEQTILAVISNSMGSEKPNTSIFNLEFPTSECADFSARV